VHPEPLLEVHRRALACNRIHRIHPRSAQPREQLPQFEPACPGQRTYLPGRQTLDPERRKPLPHALEQPLQSVQPLDSGRAMLGLYQRAEARPAHLNRFANLCARVGQGIPPQRRAIDRDAARKEIADHALRMQPAPYHVGFHADPHQIVAAKAIQSLFPADPHGKILRQRERPQCFRTTRIATTTAISPTATHSSHMVTAAVFSNLATRSSMLSIPIRMRVTSTPNCADCLLCSCNWLRMPDCSSATWRNEPRTSPDSVTMALSRALSRSVRLARYLSHAGTSREK